MIYYYLSKYFLYHIYQQYLRRIFMRHSFETNRLIIRRYTDTDIDAFWNVVKNEKIYKTTYAIPKYYPKERVKWWFNYQNSEYKNGTSYEYGIFNKDNGTYIGNCGIINIKKNLFSGAISYFIDPNMWNKGYATEAALQMLNFAFYDLFLVRVSGTCMSSNIASRRVMEKINFKFEGTGRSELCKDGKFIDVDHLSILRHEFIK